MRLVFRDANPGCGIGRSEYEGTPMHAVTQAAPYTRLLALAEFVRRHSRADPGEQIDHRSLRLAVDTLDPFRCRLA